MDNTSTLDCLDTTLSSTFETDPGLEFSGIIGFLPHSPVLLDHPDGNDVWDALIEPSGVTWPETWRRQLEKALASDRLLTSKAAWMHDAQPPLTDSQMDEELGIVRPLDLRTVPSTSTPSTYCELVSQARTVPQYAEITLVSEEEQVPCAVPQSPVKTIAKPTIEIADLVSDSSQDSDSFYEKVSQWLDTTYPEGIMNSGDTQNTLTALKPCKRSCSNEDNGTNRKKRV